MKEKHNVIMEFQDFPVWRTRLKIRTHISVLLLSFFYLNKSLNYSNTFETCVFVCVVCHIQVLLAQRSRLKSKRFTSRHIIKLLKDKEKEKILKEAIEKWFIIYKGSSVRFLIKNFLGEKAVRWFSQSAQNKKYQL